MRYVIDINDGFAFFGDGTVASIEPRRVVSVYPMADGSPKWPSGKTSKPVVKLVGGDDREALEQVRLWFAAGCPDPKTVPVRSDDGCTRCSFRGERDDACMNLDCPDPLRYTISDTERRRQNAHDVETPIP